jgi:hypothetical protein
MGNFEMFKKGNWYDHMYVFWGYLWLIWGGRSEIWAAKKDAFSVFQLRDDDVWEEMMGEYGEKWADSRHWGGSINRNCCLMGYGKGVSDEEEGGVLDNQEDGEMGMFS